MTGLSASSRAKCGELAKLVVQTLQKAGRAYKMSELFDALKEAYKEGFTQVCLGKPGNMSTIQCAGKLQLWPFLTPSPSSSKNYW